MVQERTAEVLEDLVWQLQRAKMVGELVLIPGVLKTLNMREREILSARFGIISGEPQTLAEVSRLTSIDPKSIRLIETKAIRKLMHPTRFWLFQTKLSEDK
jgi:RNA polymerase primary sigma factor